MPQHDPLTPAKLKSLKPPAAGQVEHVDGGCPGLRLRLSHGGTASWVLGCRDALGKPRRFVLGAYPAVGLAVARDLARARREEVRQGADPIAQRREERRKAEAASRDPATLAALLLSYEKDVGARRKSWPEARRRIEHVFAAHLQRPVATLTAPVLQLTVDQHASRTSAGAAVRYLRPVLRWGAKRGLLPRGTGEALDPPEGSLAVRERVLTRDEIKAILGALGDAGVHGRVFKWLFWTAARLGEVCGMRWGHIDLKNGIWTLPAGATKQGRQHVVPLPQAAREMLDGMLPRDEQGKVIQPDPEALVFCTASGKPLGNFDRETKLVMKASGTAGWHRHDIRRTVASLLGDLGVPPHVIEIALGHALRTSADGSAVGRVAQIYNRSRYRQEHAEALELLASELERIEKGGDNVIRLRAH